MKNIYGDFRLGVLGGGQLGRMLIQSAMNFNISTVILDPDPKAPCKDLATEFHVGKLTDFDTVYEFGRKVDLLTIEIENVNVDALEQLESEGIKVFPQSRVIKMIQDKGLQKQFYLENDIPTAEFRLIENKDELEQHLDFFPVFQKLRTEGYDGRGVQRLNTAEDLSKAFEKPTVLEKLVDFEKEISVIVARNEKGEVKAFPAVGLEFHAEANLVEFLYSPAGLTEEQEQEAEDIATKLIEALDMVGLLAVEMFLTKDGKVLVNEIAPRTHNSGHHSIEGNITSQFEQHLRAILDMPLGATDIKIPAVMVNLLGEDGYAGPAKYQGMDEVLAKGGVAIHLYGKVMTKPFRKMGHITIVDQDLDKAKEKAKFVKDTLKVIA